MDPINPRQVLADLESLIGQREMIRHCATYLRERNTLISPDGPVYPISWTSIARPPEPADGGDDEELKDIERRVKKGMGAPKKAVPSREPVDFGPVARALVFAPIKCEKQQ